MRTLKADFALGNIQRDIALLSSICHETFFKFLKPYKESEMPEKQRRSKNNSIKQPLNKEYSTHIWFEMPFEVPHGTEMTFI